MCRGCYDCITASVRFARNAAGKSDNAEKVVRHSKFYYICGLLGK